MYQEIETKQLIKKNNYTLSLTKIQKGIQLTLMIQASKQKKQFYHIIIRSLSDVKGLQSQFQSVNLLRDYLQDPSNIEVDIENKRVQVIELDKKNKKIIEVGTIQLELKQIKEVSGEHQLLNTVLQRCQSKKVLGDEQIKDILQKMAMCLSQLLVQKTVLSAQKQQLEQKNRILHEQLNNSQCESKLNGKEHISINEANEIKRQIKDMKQSFEVRLADLESKIETVSKQKLDYTENMYINEQNNQKIQNIIVSRLREEEEVKQMKEKLLKIQERFKSGIKEQNIMTESSSVLNIKDLIDEQSLWMKKLVLNGNTMTSKQYTHVFGKKKLSGKCSYKINFSKIDMNGVGLGIITSSAKNKNVISLKEWINYQNSGVYEQGGEIVGMATPFNAKQQVTVEMDFQSGIIKWKVGSDIRCQQQFPILKQESISWVSYIYFGNKDITATIAH